RTRRWRSRPVKSLLRRELVYRRLLIRLTRLENHRWEVRVIDGIREVLGFQAESRVLLVHNAASSGLLAVEEIAGVKLHSRLGCIHLHHAARLRIAHPRRQG